MPKLKLSAYTAQRRQKISGRRERNLPRYGCSRLRLPRGGVNGLGAFEGLAFQRDAMHQTPLTVVVAFLIVGLVLLFGGWGLRRRLRGNGPF